MVEGSGKRTRAKRPRGRTTNRPPRTSSMGKNLKWGSRWGWGRSRRGNERDEERGKSERGMLGPWEGTAIARETNKQRFGWVVIS